METSSRVLVAGHRRLVGSAIIRRLGRIGALNVQTASRELASTYRRFLTHQGDLRQTGQQVPEGRAEQRA